MTNKQTNEKTQEKTFPFSYVEWDESGSEYGDIEFHDVEFTSDWGPIKKGERFNSVTVEYSKGRMCLQNLKNPSKGDVESQINLNWHAVPS